MATMHAGICGFESNQSGIETDSAVLAEAKKLTAFESNQSGIETIRYLPLSMIQIAV